MLIAININHQKLIFGDILINPLNKIMFGMNIFYINHLLEEIMLMMIVHGQIL